jgi:hypothetical protein
MAGDWIKMRCDLPNDPAVYKIAALTKLDRFSVVGRLYAFWSWADKHAVDGRVDGATSHVIDDITACAGFAAALVSVRWLVALEESVEIPHYERHNGESAKERGLKNARQARWREGKASCTSTDVDAPPSTKASTREEKRREDSSEAKASGASAGKEKTTDPDEIIFGYGVPILVNAGTAEKHARSFLGKLRKEHGDASLIDALRQCLKVKPLQPLEWLAAAMPPKAITSGDTVAAKAVDETRKYLDEQKLTPEQKALADKAAAQALSALRGVTKRSAA